VGKAVDKLGDPEVRDERRAIAVKGLVEDLLDNDEVISKYPREEVINFYNDLSKLSPTTAEQPLLVRGLLRRALSQGYLDTFEVGQVAGTESQLLNNRKVDNTREEALRADSRGMRPDLYQVAKTKTLDVLKGAVPEALGGSKAGIRYMDPELAMKAKELGLRTKEVKDRKEQSKAELAARQADTEGRKQTEAERLKAQSEFQVKQLDAQTKSTANQTVAARAAAAAQAAQAGAMSEQAQAIRDAAAAEAHARRQETAAANKRKLDGIIGVYPAGYSQPSGSGSQPIPVPSTPQLGP